MKEKFILTLLLVLGSYFLNAQQDLPSTPKVAESKKYGLKPDQPIKVGGGVIPAKVYDYLRGLRTPDGKPVEFKRIGTGPSYSNPDSNLTPYKEGVLTMFNIKTSKGKWVVVFFDQYRYQEPKLLQGFLWKE